MPRTSTYTSGLHGMGLRKVGYFRELPHGDPEGPSLVASLRDGPRPEHSRVVAYLESGVGLIGCGGRTYDVLSPTREPIGPPHILTDGVWQWPADLAYYVSRYYADLPGDFVDHMRAANWTIDPTRIDVASLGRSWR